MCCIKYAVASKMAQRPLPSLADLAWIFRLRRTDAHFLSRAIAGSGQCQWTSSVRHAPRTLARWRVWHSAPVTWLHWARHQQLAVPAVPRGYVQGHSGQYPMHVMPCQYIFSYVCGRKHHCTRVRYQLLSTSTAKLWTGPRVSRVPPIPARQRAAEHVCATKAWGPLAGRAQYALQTITLLQSKAAQPAWHAPQATRLLRAAALLQTAR
jgi:hypothetical protein